jgi:peptidoglycan/xylan/chitin deacetylase (PgdA/CDA1 family)
MQKKSKIVLTFDVEEFDLPLEYNSIISEEEMMAVGKKGLDAITELIHQNNITTTLFTTAHFADQFPDTIKKLSEDHEIASHTYFHSHFKIEDLKSSKLRLEAITGKEIVGLRMPRFKKVAIEEIKKAGYQYDSSINPFWLPGRYNNLHLPKKIYTESDIFRVPITVSPNLRIPLFWLAFKNLPLGVYKYLALRALKNYGYINLYFHPWEFTPLDNYPLPGYIKKDAGERMLEKLNELISFLKNNGEFVTMRELVDDEKV